MEPKTVRISIDELTVLVAKEAARRLSLPEDASVSLNIDFGFSRQGNSLRITHLDVALTDLIE